MWVYERPGGPLPESDATLLPHHPLHFRSNLLLGPFEGL